MNNLADRKEVGADSKQQPKTDAVFGTGGWGCKHRPKDKEHHTGCRNGGCPYKKALRQLL